MVIKKILLVFIIMLNAAVTAAAEVIKSPADSRDYRHFVLENGLKVVLVSDPNVDKSAASLDVAVGSGTDPKEWPGMAHFLEHMLFLGTEKFPESGEYQAFIQQNGGHTNAFTAYDHTNYFYDIDPASLKESLDRFAQFFISPLLNAEFVERERNAVDSEYYARRTDDFRRTWSARKRVFNPLHPVTKFSIGNNQTLADKPQQSVRNALLEFHKNYYSANIMSLAIVGRDSLDEMEAWVRGLFDGIPNRGIKSFEANVPIYVDGSLPKLLEVKTLKQRYSIGLNFALPETRTHYKTKPLQYLSNLLGHEGKGSLLSYLKSRDWVESLSAGTELNNPEGSSFSISIRATEEGFGNWTEIVNSILSYVNLIQQSGVEQWRYQELDDVSRINFDYLQKNDSSDYAVLLSSSLQEYPAEELLTASYLMSDYDEALIKDFVDRISVDNLLVTLSSPQFESDDVTAYFDTPYKVSDLPEKITTKTKSNGRDSFFLPEKNPFVPEKMDLKTIEKEMMHPQLLVNEEHFKFIYQNDPEFEAPRASTYVSIRSPIAGKSARAEVLAQLYTKMIKEQLNEEVYPATLVGLSLDVYSHLRGMTIRISGFDDKQKELLARILDELSAEFKQSVFDLKKSELINKFENEKHDTPYFRLYDQANDLLVENSWPNAILLSELNIIDLQDVENFRDEFFKSIEVIGLSHGNVTEQDANGVAQLLRETFIDQYKLTTVGKSRVVDLIPGSKTMVSLDLEHEDSAVVLFKQAKGETIKDKALIYMLYQLLEAPFFHQLRTVEQLGYIVYASPYLSLNTPYIALIVESPSTSVAEILNRMNVFLEGFKGQIANLTEEEFSAAKKGLIIKTDKKDDTLEDRSNRYWSEIDRENYDFDSRKKLTQAINDLSLEQVIAEYEKVFFDPSYGEFIAVAPGQQEFDPKADSLKDYKTVTDPKEFKLSAKYFD